MNTNVKKFVPVTCLLILGLIELRMLNRAPILPASDGRDGASPTVSDTVAESTKKVPLRGPLSNPSPGPEPILKTATSAPLEPPAGSDEVREWARNQPEAALAWMVNAPAGEKRDAVVEIVCAHVAESNPAEAVSLAERYSGGCSTLLENLVQQWAEQNEPDARAYAMSKPIGPERDRLLSRVAFTRSKENPAEAAQLVAQWISPGAVQNEAAISVLHQWALRDPRAALAWAKFFPEESLRERGLREVAGILARGRE